MKVPYAALGWATVGGLALFRTFYRPARAVVADGFVLRCAGGNPCNDSMLIDSFSGKAGVFSLVAGRVLRADSGSILVAADTEPTVLSYSGDASKGGLLPQVQPGDSVGVGQQIAVAERVGFAVYVLWREPDGAVKPIANEPASWLATHGMRVSEKKRAGGGAGAQWCEAGRKLVVPQQVAQCGMRLASPGAFMLLPVSASME